MHLAAVWLCLLNSLCPTEVGVSSSCSSFHCWSSCTNQFAVCNHHPLGSKGEFCPPGLLRGGMFLMLPQRSSDMQQPCSALWSKEHLKWSKSCNPAPMVPERFSDQVKVTSRLSCPPSATPGRGPAGHLAKAREAPSLLGGQEPVVGSPGARGSLCLISPHLTTAPRGESLRSRFA